VLASTSIRGREGASGSPGAASVPRHFLDFSFQFIGEWIEAVHKERFGLCCSHPSPQNDFGGIPLGFDRLGMNPEYKGMMYIQSRFILTITSLAFALACGLSNEVRADELKEAKVTQVIQDVRVLPSNASPRPAAVNDNVSQGTAVQTGVQSRSELTFKDQTITRLGEKTIFSVGEGPRTIDLGSGQFLLYVPKKAGGAKVKMGPVTG
jgi:hypothetical protein